MSDGTYKLDDLARAAGTSARTVRYYVQRGLIPAPVFKGKDTAYGEQHLVRLRAIRRLQAAFFPLDAIAVELERRPLSDIERIADGKEMPASAGSGASAVEIRQTAVPVTSVSSITTSSARSRNERLFRRIELAPGVELSVAEDLPEESRQIVETILRVQGVSKA